MGIRMKYDFDLELVNNNSLLLILQQIKKGSVVLEFGPANGRLTKYLKNELHCEVYLAELDEEAGREALQYGKDLVVGDVENYEWFEKYHEIRFDYILFADILEHLREPKDVLAKSKLLLKQNGSILLSVPNMAHNSVLINLMKNELTYTSVGLLDNTHIHFFTYHSLEQMIKDCDLYPCKKMGTYCEVGKNEIINSIYDVPGISPEYWYSRKYGEVYQFVYELKKGKEYIDEEVNILNPFYHHYWLQTYIDDGTGMKEEVSSKYNYDINVKNHRFELSLDSECETFRLDPVNTSCVIKINCISVRHDGVESVVEEYTSNAEHVFNNIYCFHTDDPMILINTSEMRKFNEAKIIIDFDIISFDSLCVDHMQAIVEELMHTFDAQQSKMNDLNSEIAILNSKVNELNRQIQNLNKEKEELSAIINNGSKKNRFGMKNL